MSGQGQLLDRELLVVTGKGGSGRTTVAAALGLACARAGRRTIVCEVLGQSGVPRLLDRPAAERPGEEAEIAPGLWAMTIDPERAMAEWAGSEVLPRPLVELLMRSSAFSAFVAAAPGARELVTATKSWELGRSGALGRGKRWSSRPGYDVVVLDAPASGHGLAMLSTPRTFADIARVGPVAVQARRAAELLEHPSRTGLISVARAEETPVNETLEFGAQSQAVLGHGPALIAVSAVHGAGLRTAERELVLAGDGAVPAAVVGAIRTRAARTRVQDTQLARLRRQADAPVVTLPFVTGPISAVDVELLARKLGPALAAG